MIEAYMIFLTSFDRDFNIYHFRGNEVRRPTLLYAREYQASKIIGTFFE